MTPATIQANLQYYKAKKEAAHIELCKWKRLEGEMLIKLAHEVKK